MRRGRAILAVLALSALSGCRTVGANSVIGAAIMTPVAIGSAAVSRATGHCYAACTPGTVCNENTGLCERMPCGGFCPPDTLCERSTDRCIAAETPVLGVGKEQESEEKKPPPATWTPVQPLEPQPPN